MVSAGDPSPEFNVQAAVSEREISPATLAGRRAVIVLHGARTSDAPKVVGKAVRAKFPDAGDVMVVNVVNLKAMAGLWKKVADAQIKSTYEKLSGKITDADPADLVIICPDYENAVGPLFGFEDTNTQAGVVVLQGDGKILGMTQEGDLAEQTLSWLA